MSLAVFTDSTTAHESPAFNSRSNCGSSTKTMSVSSCCAWSVMPTVAVSPETRTHSCDFAYFKSKGTFELIKVPAGYADGRDSQSFLGPMAGLFLVNWLLDD